MLKRDFENKIISETQINLERAWCLKVKNIPEVSLPLCVFNLTLSFEKTGEKNPRKYIAVYSGKETKLFKCI